jgi:DNA-binding NarL/FixJ family response regulator
VVIVDDARALCDLRRDRLDDEPGLSCAGVATTPDDARSVVAARLPFVIIVDVGLGDGVDALDLVSDLVAASPTSQVLIWTKWSDPSVERAEEIRRKVRALRNGASDWIAKGDGIEKLVDRIRSAIRRGPRLAAETPSPIEASLDDLVGIQPPRTTMRSTDDADGLTPAERRAAEVSAHGLEHGMTIEQIARSLKITIQTLRTHLRSIYVKWDVHGQAHFVAEARRRGLL